MIDGLTIWLRQCLADINDRVRELFRRQARKIVEIVLTDVDLMARLRDASTTAVFEERHLRDAAGYKTRLALHRAMLREIRHKDGLHLEFGVYKGNSINHFAGLVPNVTWYGFDSFEGLAGGLDTWRQGRRVQHRRNLPPVRGNVRLTKGFFENTLPASSRGIPAKDRAPAHRLRSLQLDRDHS